MALLSTWIVSLMEDLIKKSIKTEESHMERIFEQYERYSYTEIQCATDEIQQNVNSTLLNFILQIFNFFKTCFFDFTKKPEVPPNGFKFQIHSRINLWLNQFLSFRKRTKHCKNRIPKTRKIDIKLYHSCQSLTNSLIIMFSKDKKCGEDDYILTY
ncbi:hypothetical protein E1A91_A10G104100v1 [Gossypium mustelinum]|uniref:Uncharacterized protein n=1 Tax=Gossypium mustelinum TaxID=34275 RepID=A0A5D2XJT6_GOSMU|nr:hypothetical protein E1A91_A10G104100v1 [Gossypium mustelinum]